MPLLAFLHLPPNLKQLQISSAYHFLNLQPFDFKLAVLIAKFAIISFEAIAFLFMFSDFLFDLGELVIWRLNLPLQLLIDINENLIVPFKSVVFHPQLHAFFTHGHAKCHLITLVLRRYCFSQIHRVFNFRLLWHHLVLFKSVSIVIILMNKLRLIRILIGQIYRDSACIIVGQGFRFVFNQGSYLFSSLCVEWGDDLTGQVFIREFGLLPHHSLHVVIVCKDVLQPLIIGGLREPKLGQVPERAHYRKENMILGEQNRVYQELLLWVQDLTDWSASLPRDSGWMQEVEYGIHKALEVVPSAQRAAR